MAAGLSMCYLALVVSAVFSFSNGQNVFTYTVNNQLVEPYFSHSVDLDITGDNNLFFYMTKAVNKSADITEFSVTYFANLGFAIDSINNLFDEWVTNDILYFWSISNQLGRLQVGVSTYRPRKDDIVVHNYTIYVRGGPH